MSSGWLVRPTPGPIDWSTEYKFPCIVCGFTFYEGDLTPEGRCTISFNGKTPCADLPSSELGGNPEKGTG